MQETLNIITSTPYFTPSAIIFSSIILGVIFQKVIKVKLQKFSKKTKWKGDDIIIKHLGSAPVLWILLGGIYIAGMNTNLPELYKHLLWQVLLIALIVSISIIGTKIAEDFIRIQGLKSEGGLPSTSIFTWLTKITIFILAVLVVLQTFGISITPLLTALGVGGLAVALALQDTLSNLFSGIYMIASKKFRPGDFIELESGDSGYIEDITWRNTTIKMLSNNLVILPNSKIANSKLINYSKPQKEMSVLVDCGVSYNSDLEKVERVTIEVAKEIMSKAEEAVDEFEPFIRFHTFGDSSINFTVILRVTEFVNQYIIKHEFVKALHKRFQKEGIEIPFPQRTIHMEK